MRTMWGKCPWLAGVGLALTIVGGCQPKPEPKPQPQATDSNVGERPSVQPPAAQALPEPVTRVCESLPADAEMLAHVDLKGVGLSPLWARNRARMEKEPDTRRTVEAMEACDIPFSGLQSLDIALAPKQHKTAILVRGTSVGDPEKLTCVRNKLADILGKDDFLIDTGGEAGKAVLRLRGDRPEDAMVGHLLDANTIALATKPWADSWGARVSQQQGTAGGACKGDLNPTLARVTGGDPIWFAGLLPPDALPELSSDGVNINSVAGSLGLADGLAVELQIGLSQADKAKSMQTLVQAQLDQLASVAGQMGAPKRVLDSISLTADGSVLVLKAAIDMQAIAAMEQVMAASLGEK